MVPIDALYSELTEAQFAWTELYDMLKRGQYDTQSPRPSIDGVSVDVFHERVLLIFELIQSLRPESDEDVSATVISARVTEMRSTLNNFKNHVQPPLTQAHTHLRDNTIIKDGNNNFSWQFFDGPNNIANFDVSSNFTQMNVSLTQLMILLAQLLPICKANAISDVSARAKALADVARNVEMLRAESQKLAKAAEQSATGAAEKEKSIQAHLSSTETIHSKLHALQQEMEKEAASVNSLVAQIKTIGTNADALEKQITGYQATFDAFQKQLDERHKQFTNFEASTKAALEQNQNRELEIDRLTKNADTMIRGASTAGLSKSLEDTRVMYGKRMFWARIGFLLSIILLSISALPLAAHLLPGLFGNWFPVISEGAQSSLVGVLGKIVLLLPGSWLALFFAKAFSEFFHLEREYAHKAALAQSVEGFKREAPKYEEEITASVFGEILNNPSNRKSPEPAQHPLYEVLTKRLTELFSSKKN